MPADVQAAAPIAVRPKLVVVLVIDQFRADYLTRFESQRLGKTRAGSWVSFESDLNFYNNLEALSEKKSTR